VSESYRVDTAARWDVGGRETVPSRGYKSKKTSQPPMPVACRLRRSCRPRAASKRAKIGHKPASRTALQWPALHCQASSWKRRLVSSSAGCQQCHCQIAAGHWQLQSILTQNLRSADHRNVTCRSQRTLCCVHLLACRRGRWSGSRLAAQRSRQQKSRNTAGSNLNRRSNTRGKRAKGATGFCKKVTAA